MELIPTILILVAFFLFTAAAAVGAFAIWRLKRDEPRTLPSTEPVQDPRGAFLEELAARIAALEVVVDGLPSLWDEQVKRAANHSKRALEAERRALEVSEAGSEEPESPYHGEQLSIIDGEGGAGGGLPAMRGDVAHAPTQAELQAQADRLLAQGF
jgi:hypothetical protein